MSKYSVYSLSVH